ncbi:hypothetical protein OIU84_004866 [Salix udensis]|uniref:Uncharacterized protein n=1 Tax=Salix udensis TaxID=889485 RepID=A0AAD6K3G5_9ROSI|nr:hypothetical protein OIU84_004866 [Salix udensis]
MIKRVSTNSRILERAGDDGEGAAKGHDEGDKEEGEAVEGCDGFEDVGSSEGRRERDSGEKECEEEVGGNCEVLEGREYRVHLEQAHAPPAVVWVGDGDGNGKSIGLWTRKVCGGGFGKSLYLSGVDRQASLLF